MVAQRIYTHARQMPDKTAVIYGEHQLSYREFANAIGETRRYLGMLGLSHGGVAVLAITSILDSWVAGLAGRSLGITTIGVRSVEQLSQLGLPKIQSVVTSEIEGRVSTRFARLPDGNTSPCRAQSMLISKHLLMWNRPKCPGGRAAISS